MREKNISPFNSPYHAWEIAIFVNTEKEKLFTWLKDLYLVIESSTFGWKTEIKNFGILKHTFISL